jgi:hypothetical protein
LLDSSDFLLLNGCVPFSCSVLTGFVKIVHAIEGSWVWLNDIDSRLHSHSGLKHLCNKHAAKWALIRQMIYARGRNQPADLHDLHLQPLWLMEPKTSYD